jgi:hypothetical protein
MLLWRIAVVAGVFGTVSAPCHAEVEDTAIDEPSAPSGGTDSAWTLAATPFMSFADVCDEETTFCESRGFVGGEFGGRLWMNQRWALAPFVLLAVEAGSRGIGSSSDPICAADVPCVGSSTATSFTSQLGAVGLAAHYHPFGGGVWLAPGLGMLLHRDIADERVDGGAPTRSSLYRLGAEFGAGVGYDWHLVDRFALTFSGRVALALFPGAEPAPLQGSTASSGPLAAVAVGGWLGAD